MHILDSCDDSLLKKVLQIYKLGERPVKIEKSISVNENRLKDLVLVLNTLFNSGNR